MGQQDTGLAPQHARTALLCQRVGFAVGRLTRGLPRGYPQIIFQAPEMELHALLQPLGIGRLAPCIFFGFKVLQVQHERHHRTHHQH